MEDRGALWAVVGTAALWAGLLYIAVAGPRRWGQPDVYQVGGLALDPTGRSYWILDTGMTTHNNKPVRMASPRIIAIRPLTGEVVNVINLKGLFCAWRGVEGLLAERTEEGGTFLYLVEGGGGVVTVWDVEEKKGHRAHLPEKLKGTGPVLGIALAGVGNSSALYLSRALGLYRLETGALRRKRPLVVETLGRPPEPFTLTGSSSGSRLVFRSHRTGATLSWDTGTPFHPSNLLPIPGTPRCPKPL